MSPKHSTQVGSPDLSIPQINYGPRNVVRVISIKGTIEVLRADSVISEPQCYPPYFWDFGPFGRRIYKPQPRR
ncbi:hypothetical protein NPIL_671781 [Nephila pilipes]|uniref:Uncharacterized protein n=1 Tax=Nephila pilipes TaxID=299642 RepID=A0A8X6NTX1_NEPPI|nr:hypothetical protein NPIL_671781 [Nephila pilipes]